MSATPEHGGLSALAERDARLNTWLAGVKVGDIVTVRLNSTDTLTGKVYEAPDDSGRTALYVFTTLLRYGNGYPGGSFEPAAAPDALRERVEALATGWERDRAWLAAPGKPSDSHPATRLRALLDSTEGSA